MVDYPVDFSSSTSEKRDEDKWHLEADEGLETDMSFPEEFGGSSSEPSPETLFTASIESCFLATFKMVASRKDLDYDSVQTETVIHLDRGEDSRPVMKAGTIEFEISGAEDQEKARELIEEAGKNCFIHNSVKTDIEVKVSFE